MLVKVTTEEYVEFNQKVIHGLIQWHEIVRVCPYEERGHSQKGGGGGSRGGHSFGCLLRINRVEGLVSFGCLLMSGLNQRVPVIFNEAFLY